MTDVQVIRVDGGGRLPAIDAVAVEAPLEIRLGPVAFATIMRTPGLDRELTAGFLLAEGVLRSADDLGTIAHCTDPESTYPGNVVNVTLTGHSAAAAVDALSGRRAIVASSACGVCGRRTIDELAIHHPPVEPVGGIDPAVVTALPAALRERQAGFARTGGLHAAGLFALDGRCLAVAEDVGRHNAVDKVVGGLVLREALPARDTILFVSGRTSFEIVQKAWAAGIPCVASVSAPSSLAIEVALAAGITLMGFVRGETFNLYAGRA